MKRAWHHAVALNDALPTCGLRSNTIILTSVAVGLRQGQEILNSSLRSDSLPRHRLDWKWCMAGQWQQSLLLSAVQRSLQANVKPGLLEKLCVRLGTRRHANRK